MKIENIKQVAQTFSSVCSNFAFKCVASASYIFYAFIFNPQHEAAMIAVLILIIFDFITGISAAKFTGEEIKSSKIFRSALKVAIYFMLISAGHLTQKAVGLDFFLEETILAFLAATELISILENTGRLGFAIPQKLLNKLEAFRDNK